MSHVSESVGTCRHGSTNALPGSGNSSMSLSLIAWKPRIDEPSNPRPSVNVSSSSSLSGIEKCCQVPGRSVNRTSTTCTPASLARRITSAGVGPVDAFPAVVAVGSKVAVIARGLLPESVTRFASGGPYGKLECLLSGVKKSVHELHEMEADVRFVMWKCANCTPICATVALQRLHNVQQLDCRKLTKPLVNIFFLPFQEDPTCNLVLLTTHKVNTAPHRTHGTVGLTLEKDVPALLPTLELSHGLAVFGSGHGTYTTCFPEIS